ncbi:response regulator transcription factor [Nocardia cyriacigeorgica]|uniref:response regulator transcription factor n=1 Tax=Nocardia cyriacigeorgica TaxID=135487 RepID=UPI000CEA02A7|nr:LuxR C-terminal-related transcriptional regulator [Nocardia cyriacigeorgica]AVH22901.1 helix-turn-helix transcriptional regulator [Nocardia cyriacigeorgica]MBF6284937.1 response regulator transcription factor [Nocardia cyriacigeorgica]PPJ16605.1 helix-turn-helix transcriptional regulator [Nocardia cyriacigeorgica]BDT88289.1 helix-turn-helix transcriptional regulator [Nocardia cyriacigeorgica]
MTDPSPLLRPRDGDALRAEIRRVAGVTGVPVLFGGEVHADTLLLSEFFGVRTNGLRGLSVLRTSGLGGQVMDSGRPGLVADYRNAPTITHHYDGPVVGEGIRSVVAVPVVVDDNPRAVLYAATRGTGALGDRTADALMQAGRRLATEIAIRDEVDRRLRLLEAASAPPQPSTGVVVEELRDIHAELRDIAHSAADATLRDRLHAVGARLTRALSGEPAADAPRLSRRELDVLVQVALGCSNQEAAQRLSVGPETVKSYLRSAMNKLDAHSRHEAVVTARRLGLIP